MTCVVVARKSPTSLGSLVSLVQPSTECCGKCSPLLDEDTGDLDDEEMKPDRPLSSELGFGKGEAVTFFVIQKLSTKPLGVWTPDSHLDRLRGRSFHYQLDSLHPGGGKRIEVRAAVIERRRIFSWDDLVRCRLG